MAGQHLSAERCADQGKRDLRRKWKCPTGTPEYYAWRSMRDRCTNEQSPAWENYGGRGIGVCERWASSYDAFYEDMGKRPDGMTLERIDVDKDYSPENCKWASWGVQRRNKRTNRLLTKDGKTQTLTDWANDLGIRVDTLHKRLKRMSVDRALTPRSLARERNMRHGSRSMYEFGCRCSRCKETHNARMRAQRKRRKSDLAGYAACGGELAAK